MTREEVAALLGGGRLYSAGRDRLYTVDELMAGYRTDAPMQSLDARIAAHVKAAGIPPADVEEAIAQVVHDQGVDQAMRAFVAASVADGRDVAGVMGGASTPRDAPAYRLAAQTAKALSEAGFLVATGGGLGIMEAGNLGAYFAGRPDDELDAAIDDLERCPTYWGHEAEYVDSARVDRLPPARRRAEPGRCHLALRERADQPVRHPHRQALPERGPRGRPAQHRQRRSDLLRGQLRNASGDLPGPRPERLRRPRGAGAMVFVGTAAYGRPGSPFHLARAQARRAAAPFDDLVTLADSADAVVAAITAARDRRLVTPPRPADPSAGRRPSSG